MRVNYDKLWKLLIDRKMTKTDLRRQSGISTNALAKMGHEEPVTMECLYKVCLALRCTPNDVLSFEFSDV